MAEQAPTSPTETETSEAETVQEEAETAPAEAEDAEEETEDAPAEAEDAEEEPETAEPEAEEETGSGMPELEAEPEGPAPAEEAQQSLPASQPPGPAYTPLRSSVPAATTRWGELFSQVQTPVNPGPDIIESLVSASSVHFARIQQLDDVLERFQMILDQSIGRLDNETQRLANMQRQDRATLNRQTFILNAVTQELGMDVTKIQAPANRPNTAPFGGSFNTRAMADGYQWQNAGQQRNGGGGRGGRRRGRQSRRSRRPRRHPRPRRRWR